MAAGKVVTGFSKPYVAVYNSASGTVSYTKAQLLARGVDVSISPESSSDNILYADNAAAESAGGYFTGGTVTLTVDGLLLAAEDLIMGLSEADSDGWTHYTATSNPPYVGIGFVVRYIQDGVTSYQAVILTKAKFDLIETSAATQGDTVDFQTQSLTAQLFKDDTVAGDWKLLGEEKTTEADAVTMITTKFA